MSDIQSCDILIIGAGPAGLSAALAAAPGGASIVIIDDNPFAGGQIWRDGKGAHIPVQARRIKQQIQQYDNITCIQQGRIISVVNTLMDNMSFAVLLETPDKSWIQHCKKLILCTGGRELLLPFPGWTQPGVTGAGGLQALIKSGLPVAGQRIVVAGTGPLLLATAKTARQAGADIILIAEQTPLSTWLRFGLSLWRWPQKLLQACQLMTPRLQTQTYVKAVALHGTQLRVTLVHQQKTFSVDCDRLACGYGLIPNTQLAQLLRCELEGNLGIKVNDAMQTTVAGIYAAGECTGFGGCDKAIVQGRIAGYHAAGELAKATFLIAKQRHWQRFSQQLRQSFVIDPDILNLSEDDTIICRCEDVTYSQLKHRQGWIDAKLHTRCGMGPCQGRICGAAVQKMFRWQSVPQRYLLAPVRIETLVNCQTDKT